MILSLFPPRSWAITWISCSYRDITITFSQSKLFIPRTRMYTCMYTVLCSFMITDKNTQQTDSCTDTTYCPPKVSDHHEYGSLHQQKRGLIETTDLQIGSQKYFKLIVICTLIANKCLFCFIYFVSLGSLHSFEFAVCVYL